MKRLNRSDLRAIVGGAVCEGCSGPGAQVRHGRGPQMSVLTPAGVSVTLTGKPGGHHGNGPVESGTIKVEGMK